jgi:hypothetical protein
MIELLALPGWKTPPTSLVAWADALRTVRPDHEVTTTRESTSAAWLEIPALRLSGYAVLQGEQVEAVNFELAGTGDEANPARLAIEQAAAGLGWEVHDDDGEDDDES